MTITEFVDCLEAIVADADGVERNKKADWHIVCDSLKDSSPQQIKQIIFDKDARTFTIIHT